MATEYNLVPVRAEGAPEHPYDRPRSESAMRAQAVAYCEWVRRIGLEPDALALAAAGFQAASRVD